MKKAINFLVLLFVISCNKNTIKLFKNNYLDDFITIEEDKVIYFFPKNEVIKRYPHFLNTLPFNNERNKDSLVFEYIKVGNPVKFPNSQFALSGNVICYSLYEIKYEMLKEGECKIFNKKDEKFEPKVICKSEKGLYGQRNDIFLFPNGEPFFSYITAYGE